MSIARHHNEWLNLIDRSGPFLSLPVLMRAFPQGLPAVEPETVDALRLAYGEWRDAAPMLGALAPEHRAWVEHVLHAVLGFPESAVPHGQAIPPTLKAYVAEHGETIRPDLVLLDRGKARLLIMVLDPRHGPERPVPGRIWNASPATRMMELLHATGVPLGLVTNGEQWMLVFARPGEPTGYATWHAEYWLEERITLRAFRAFLAGSRFFAAPAGETPEGMLEASASEQQEVTDQLGYQVRAAVEVLVSALDRADMDRRRELLRDVAPAELYEAALTVMMRLVFLMAAEERRLLPLGSELYDRFYAISTLQAQLRETADQNGEEVIDLRFDAWSRLLATFRAVHGGIEHELLSLVPYGGHLFDPDRFPFLEGRPRGTRWRETPAQPLPVSNRTVLHLLEALQFLTMRIPGGGPSERRRLSFRELDIEQLGHVYEGLLDHTAFRAGEVVLGLAGTREKQPEVPLRRLEELRAAGGGALIDFLRAETGRQAAALTRALEQPAIDLDEARFRAACGNDAALWDRVRPFAGLVRRNDVGYPVVVLPGSVYVTEGTDRRTSGTQYTPRTITEPVVRHALEPLVYRGPAEGASPPWELRPARELLALKICDMACGSGAFLVEACRYLADRLMEAWARAEEANPGISILPEGGPATGNPAELPLPRDAEERRIFARRLVAQRCLYGVDKNPQAVEMAKLSLWLLTLEKDRPFTFLDHAIKCGDSLLGVTSRAQVENFDFVARPAEPRQIVFWQRPSRLLLDRAIRSRRQLEASPVMTAADAERKETLLREAENATDMLRLVCDQLVAAAIGAANGRRLEDNEEFDRRRVAFWYAFQEAYGYNQDVSSGYEALTRTRPEVRRMLDTDLPKGAPGRDPFHWCIEFPEVLIDAEGFDAVIGNPPFMGGQKITGALGTAYRDHLVGLIAGGRRGSADLCSYFFLRGWEILRAPGSCALIATNTIAQGDTREVGLDQLAARDAVITRAIPSRKWPGQANLEVAQVWLRKGEWSNGYVLEDRRVAGITAQLTEPGEVAGTPYRLKANEGKSFIGSYVLGMGFVLTPDEAEALKARDQRNGDVLFPYLNGEDLNSRPDQSPSRWVINFRDWPLRREIPRCWKDLDERERRAMLRSGIVTLDYPEPVAADYPDCLAIVVEKVKPERDRNNRNVYRDRWWQYAEKRPELYAAIAGLERVLITAQTSRRWEPAFHQRSIVYSHSTVVFALQSWAEYAIMQAAGHEEWRLKYGPTLRLDARYTPSDCFETYPFPDLLAGLDAIGQCYHEHRQATMLARNEGLTAIYNRLHNRHEAAPDIQHLRDLHVKMDNAVADAYGWTNLNLDHGFHETRQGLRFTISEAARRTILDRLLKLNHERHAAEVAAGVHEEPAAKKKTGRSRRAKDDAGVPGPLFE